MTSLRANRKLDLWWVDPGGLAGMSVPDVHLQRMVGKQQQLNDWDDDLPALWQAGVRAICCLLDYPELTRAYAAAGFVCHELPLPDGGAPTKEQFTGFLSFIARQRGLGNAMAGQKRLREAAECYVEATRVCPKDPRSCVLLETLLCEHPELQPDFSEAAKRCRELVDDAAGGA